MTNAGRTTFQFSKAMETAPPLSSNNWTTSYLFNAGLKGEVGGYHWEVSYIHNTNQQFTRNEANINLTRAFAALNAVRDGGGNIVCNVTLTNPGLLPGCVPVNLFGPGSKLRRCSPISWRIPASPPPR